MTVDWVEYQNLGDGKFGNGVDAAPHAPKVSLVGVTANLITAGLGVGILSLPWATAGASILPSMATIILVMGLNVVTIMILIEAAERYQAFDIGALVGHLPGRWSWLVQIVCNVMTGASVYLCLVGILVVVADSLQPFVASFLGHTSADMLSGELYWSVRMPLLLFGAVAALPLCFLDQRHLSFSSSFGILVNVYLFALIAALLNDNGVAPEACWLGVTTGAVTMFSCLMQSAIVQMCVLPMYEELENRTPRRFMTAVVVAFAFLSALFGAFSATGYLLYGSSVHANVIQDLPSDMHGTIARVGLVLAVLAVYPLFASSVVAPVRHWEDRHSNGGRWRSVVTTTAIVLATAVGGLFVSQLGTLNQMNGALQVCCFIGIVPGLSGLFLLGREAPAWRMLMYLLLGFSLVASAAGLLYTKNEVDELRSGCLWPVIASD